MLHLLLMASVIVVNPDDIMDHPLPKAPIARWADAPGRARITLSVPGALLRGYSYRGGDAKGPVLIVFAGSGNLIERHDGAARGLAAHAASVVEYDYRGYGFSTGTAHFDDLRLDGLRIFDATTRSASGHHVVVLGYSMGTAIAEYVAMHRRVSGLILAAPWSDALAALRYQDPKHAYRLSPAASVAFDEVAMVRRIDIPLLVFQGTKDDEIPPDEGPALEKLAASNEKRFVPIVGAKHDWLLENAHSQTAVAVFLEQFRTVI
jgi:uncharacterized protein